MRARANGGGQLMDKPTVMVLHGGPGLDHTSLVEWLAPLTDALQLLYVDHRGNGRSSRPPLETCTLEAMASGEFVEAAWDRATERATPEQLVEVAHVLRGTLRDDAHLRGPCACSRRFTSTRPSTRRRRPTGRSCTRRC